MALVRELNSSKLNKGQFPCKKNWRWHSPFQADETILNRILTQINQHQSHWHRIFAWYDKRLKEKWRSKYLPKDPEGERLAWTIIFTMKCEASFAWSTSSLASASVVTRRFSSNRCRISFFDSDSISWSPANVRRVARSRDLYAASASALAISLRPSLRFCCLDHSITRFACFLSSSLNCGLYWANRVT